VRYVSTRGDAPELGFADVLLAGLASDGGLYVPERWPRLVRSTAHTYAERAVEVMLPFVEPDIDEITLTRLCTSCDGRFFSHRRDEGVTGRHLSVAWLADRAAAADGES